MKKYFVAIVLCLLSLNLVGCSWFGPAPISKEEQDKYAIMATKTVDEKGDPFEAIILYKKLITVFPRNDAVRVKVLDYIMAASLNMIKTQKEDQVKKGLDIALQLNGIQGGDFYVQNRIIMSYVFFAKQAMKNKQWDEAESWTTKALQLRFDSVAMQTHMDINIERSQELIAKKQYADAKKYLLDVVAIANITDNNHRFDDRKATAEKLLGQIPK